MPESELEKERDQNDLANVLDDQCKNANSSSNNDRSTSVNTSSENAEGAENENSDESAENESSNVSSENEIAESSNNFQAENRNNHPKRVKSSIAMLAPRAPCMRREEAEGNENTEHRNEAMGRAISCAVHLCNGKCECIGENKIQFAQARDSRKGIRVLGRKCKKVACQEMSQTRKRLPSNPIGSKSQLSRREV